MKSIDKTGNFLYINITASIVSAEITVREEYREKLFEPSTNSFLVSQTDIYYFCLLNLKDEDVHVQELQLEQ
jgi:hypothetical protein